MVYGAVSVLVNDYRENRPCILKSKLMNDYNSITQYVKHESHLNKEYINSLSVLKPGKITNLTKVKAIHFLLKMSAIEFAVILHLYSI